MIRRFWRLIPWAGAHLFDDHERRGLSPYDGGGPGVGNLIFAMTRMVGIHCRHVSRETSCPRRKDRDPSREQLCTEHVRIPFHWLRLGAPHLDHRRTPRSARMLPPQDDHPRRAPRTPTSASALAREQRQSLAPSVPGWPNTPAPLAILHRLVCGPPAHSVSRRASRSLSERAYRLSCEVASTRHRHSDQPAEHSRARGTHERPVRCHVAQHAMQHVSRETAHSGPSARSHRGTWKRSPTRRSVELTNGGQIWRASADGETCSRTTRAPSRQSRDEIGRGLRRVASRLAGAPDQRGRSVSHTRASFRKGGALTMSRPVGRDASFQWHASQRWCDEQRVTLEATNVSRETRVCRAS